MDTLIGAGVAVLIAIAGGLLRLSGQLGRLTEAIKSQEGRLSRIETVMYGWLDRGHQSREDR